MVQKGAQTFARTMLTPVHHSESAINANKQQSCIKICRKVSCSTLYHVEVRSASVHWKIHCNIHFLQGCPNPCTQLHTVQRFSSFSSRSVNSGARCLMQLHRWASGKTSLGTPDLADITHVHGQYLELKAAAELRVKATQTYPFVFFIF